MKIGFSSLSPFTCLCRFHSFILPGFTFNSPLLRLPTVSVIALPASLSSVMMSLLLFTLENILNERNFDETSDYVETERNSEVWNYALCTKYKILVRLCKNVSFILISVPGVRHLRSRSGSSIITGLLSQPHLLQSSDHWVVLNCLHPLQNYLNPL